MSYLIYDSPTKAMQVRNALSEKVEIQHSEKKTGSHSCAYALAIGKEELVQEAIDFSEKAGIEYDLFR